MKQIDLQGNIYDIGIEAKNKKLEELEEYVKSDMEIRAKLLTRIDRLNYSLEQANKEIKRLNNIINNGKERIEELKEITKDISWVELEREDYCKELDSIFRGGKE